MLSVESNSKRLVLYHNGIAVLTHQKHKPALYLLLEQNGKLRRRPVKELRIAASDTASCSFTCADSLTLTITERGAILDFSYSPHTHAIQAVSLRLNLPYKTPVWGQTLKLERLVIIGHSGAIKAKGNFVYSPRGFALGVREHEASIRKHGNQLDVVSPTGGFVVAYANDSQLAASSVHMELARHGTDPSPPDGIYIRAGGGEIAVSCKVQQILDAHIPLRGLIIEDLFASTQQSGLPWKDSYPSLATDTECYSGVGITPCAMIPLAGESANTNGAQSLQRQLSGETLHQLKASGIKYLGILTPQSVNNYSRDRLFAYAAKQTNLSGLPLGFSGVGPQADCQTWVIEEMTGSLDSKAFVRSTLIASYGAYGCHASEIPLASRFWKTESDFAYALELAIFSPILILQTGSSIDRDIPFLQTTKARILHDLLHVFIGLKPYHEHCKNRFFKVRTPTHNLPRYDNASAFKDYNAFMYGDDILVTVRQKQHTHKTECLLPEGEWIHFWTGLRYEGGRIVVNAELGYPAVFYRAESSFSDLFDTVRRTRER